MRNKIRRDGLVIPESVICYIAENVNESVRELEGIVNSLLVYSIQLKREINLDLAQRIVRKAVRCAEVKPLTVDNIIEKYAVIIKWMLLPSIPRPANVKWFKYVK